MHSCCPTSGRKECSMELKIRYENGYQTINLNTEDTKKMWVSLSLEGEGLSQEEKESRIQEAFEEQFNRPEYNNWHKETRHIDPTPKRKRMDGRRGYICGEKDDDSFDIMAGSEIRMNRLTAFFLIENSIDAESTELHPKLKEILLELRLDKDLFAHYYERIQKLLS